MNNNELRNFMKSKRRLLTANEISSASDAIAKTLFDLTEYHTSRTVMIYVSSFNEVSTKAIINRLFTDGKKVVLPISNTDTETLTLSYINDAEGLTKGAYGIPEPKVIVEALISDIDLVIVPGIVFDLKCNRIGFGKGYYDKLLCNMNAKKLAVCYDFQIVGEIACKEHDIAMDMIITEKRIIKKDVV